MKHLFLSWQLKERENRRTFSRLFSLIWRIGVICAGVIGIILNVGAFPKNPLAAFSYYTIQSNLICVILFLFLAGFSLTGTKTGRCYALVKGTVVMCILLTCFVYQLFLRPRIPNYAIPNTGDLLVHLVVPLMVLGDYLMFDPKGYYRLKDLLLWTAFPFYYPVFIVLYGLCGGTFPQADGSAGASPYFFLSADRIGWGVMLGWISGILAIFLVIALILSGIDRFFASGNGHPD